MNVRLSNLETANANWGSAIPDWVIALAKKCDELKSQVKVSKLIGYSNAAISTVLSNTYKGDLKAVEHKVRGALLKETVCCPVFGVINLKECRDYETEKRLTSGSFRMTLKRTCPKCPYNRENVNVN
tara:strand:+ start:6587 stop:6967 length:381 start_codon:yes stop_codon:yes gene_type:complete